MMIIILFSTDNQLTWLFYMSIVLFCILFSSEILRYFWNSTRLEAQLLSLWTVPRTPWLTLISLCPAFHSWNLQHHHEIFLKVPHSSHVLHPAVEKCLRYKQRVLVPSFLRASEMESNICGILTNALCSLTDGVYHIIWSGLWIPCVVDCTNKCTQTRTSFHQKIN